MHHQQQQKTVLFTINIMRSFLHKDEWFFGCEARGSGARVSGNCQFVV